MKPAQFNLIGNLRLFFKVTAIGKSHKEQVIIDDMKLASLTKVSANGQPLPLVFLIQDGRSMSFAVAHLMCKSLVIILWQVTVDILVSSATSLIVINLSAHMSSCTRAMILYDVDGLPSWRSSSQDLRPPLKREYHLNVLDLLKSNCRMQHFKSLETSFPRRNYKSMYTHCLILTSIFEMRRVLQGRLHLQSCTQRIGDIADFW
ncbi:hypothetical protein BsWGS_12204 [Bradybaena similaris]